MEKIYITFIKVNTPRGGDFYVALKSTVVSSINDLIKAGIVGACTKEEFLKKVQEIDSDAKIVGGIILSKNENIEIGGVYKPNDANEVSVDDVMNMLENRIDEFKQSLKEEFKRKGR